MKRVVPALLVLAVAGFWPILNSHPLMDDHLFFSWLERTSWRCAVWQRLTGNWIPEFTQLQMYRPVSGLWQATAYHLFRANALPHHVSNLLFHVGACFLAGMLARNLTGKREVGWLVSGLTLVHPRTALGVSLIFNFTDVISAFFMMLALLLLWAFRQNEKPLTSPKMPLRGGQQSLGSGGCSRIHPVGTSPFKGGLGSITMLGRTTTGWPSRLKLIILWTSVGLALGIKEVFLPMLAVLLAAEMMWPGDRKNLGKALIRQAGLVALGAIYLLARTRFVGHPFRTHNPVLSFPLPDHSLGWTLFWDAFLMVIAFGGMLLIRYWKALRIQLPASSDWMFLWSGCMLLPAVHFCSQVTLRPWFFDERYWYIPLFPLTMFAVALLTHGTRIGAMLGAVILAVTLPGAIGFFVAGVALLISIILLTSPAEREIQRTIAVLFLISVTLLLWQRCRQIRLRADEAARLQVQLSKVVSQTPPPSPIALLEFTEQMAEPTLSLNGLLQWLLTPPFLQMDRARLFFAYPTWDYPPTNRYWDRTTGQLLKDLDAGREVSLFSWNRESREFRSLGREQVVKTDRPITPDFQTVVMEPLETLDLRSTAGGFKTAWRSIGGPLDPLVYRALRLELRYRHGAAGSIPLEIKLRWISRHSPQWSPAKELSFHLQTSLSDAKASQTELWLYPGRRVDWLLGGEIVELQVTANRPLGLEKVQAGKTLPESVLKEARHVDEYASPGMKFLWEGEFWWRVVDPAAKVDVKPL